MASAGSCNPNPNPNPVSLASLRVCCSCSSFKIAAFPRPSSCLLKLRFSSYSRSRNCIFTIPSRPRLSFSTPVACADPDHPWQVGDPEEEAGRGHQSIQKQKLVSEQEQGGGSQLKKRVVFGLVIGICAGAVVLVGGWVFTMAMSAAIFTGSREYFELVRSQGISAGMTPPPRYVSRVCSVICALMPILTLYFGDMGVSVTLSAFIIAMALILQRGNPRFAQLSSAIFGLFYCGYLPSFWVKLRCGLAAPALNTKIGTMWPVLLGGQAHWTVGLVATLISISSIVAADSFAFLGGKIMNPAHPLLGTYSTNLSPCQCHLEPLSALLK